METKMAKSKVNAPADTTSDHDGSQSKPVQLVWGENGEYSVAWADLPESTRIALAQSGFTHKLGNEVASAITAAKAKRQKGADGKDTATPKYAESELLVMAHEKRDALITAMKGGTFITRIGAPKLRGFDAILRDVAEFQLKAAYAKKGVALPKGDAWKAKVADAMANSAKVRAEAQRQFDAAQGEDIDIEL
jgi:hypothetical protein